MRIAHISTQYSWRGGEQQIYYLHEELSDKNIDSIVLAKKNSEITSRIKSRGLSLEEFSFRSAYDLSTAWRIKSYANDQKVDLVHTHTAKAHTLAIFAALFGMKAKIIVSRRVDVPVKNNWFSRYKYNHSGVSSIICVSEKIKEITGERIKDSDKLYTVYSGVDLKKFQNIERGRLRSQFAIKENYKIVGNISALAEHKDLPTFLRTAKRLLAEKTNLKFVIVGEGKERAAIEKMIVELDLKGKVILTGFRKDIPEILADIDVFLFTSKTEGLGTTILDALASGTPVVATRAGGVPEIIEKDGAGILSAIGDVESLASNVKSILDNQEIRKSIIEKGFQTAKTFSKTVTAEKTLNLYQTLL